jgi:predicted AAA+ superfamily ATPase
MIIIHIMTNSQPFLPQYLAKHRARALKSSPVVVLTGARQAGKSTLVQHLDEKSPRLYDTLVDLDTLELATTNPG